MNIRELDYKGKSVLICGSESQATKILEEFFKLKIKGLAMPIIVIQDEKQSIPEKVKSELLINPMPIIPAHNYLIDYKSGKEKRRERRKQKRNLKTQK